MADRRVFVWTLSTCPWCRKTKQWLTSRGIEYEFVDLDTLSDGEYEAAMAEMRRFSSARSFPIVLIGDTVVVGYQPEKYAAALGIDP